MHSAKNRLAKHSGIFNNKLCYELDEQRHANAAIIYVLPDIDT